MQNKKKTANCSSQSPDCERDISNRQRRWRVTQRHVNPPTNLSERLANNKKTDFTVTPPVKAVAFICMPRIIHSRPKRSRETCFLILQILRILQILLSIASYAEAGSFTNQPIRTPCEQQKSKPLSIALRYYKHAALKSADNVVISKLQKNHWSTIP